MSSTPSSEPIARTLLALAASAGIGVAALYQGTLGFRVVSSESARRLTVAEHPPVLPAMTVRAADGHTTPLARDLEADGRAAIVTFFYTRCVSVCSALGTELQQLQARLRARGLARRIRLVAISFDPADDDRALAGYAERMGSDPALWRMYAIPDGGERARALAAFGITVIPTPLGDYLHNGAFHVVDREGRLRRVVDEDAPQAAIEAALAAES